MKRILLIAALIAAGFLGITQLTRSPTTEGLLQGSDRTLAQAFESRRSSFQVDGHGKVVHVLSDDATGDRHQRFILRLGSGQTLLVAHNIDRAPRVEGLRVGDDVRFRGEYEWNPSGGVIHWTHRAPGGGHPAGWLRHEGRVYQ